MDKKQAKKLATEANRRKIEQANAESNKYKREEQDFIRLAKLDALKHLSSILESVEKKAREGLLTECIRIEYRDEKHGFTYIRSLGEELQALLEKKGFKVRFLHERQGGNIFEGYMNPEVVGWEYSNDLLKLYISWE